MSTENRGELKRSVYWCTWWSRHRRYGRGQKRKASKRKEKERIRETKREASVKGKEEKAFLPIIAAKISRRELLEERETLRNKDEERPFCQHAVSCHCAVAPSAIRQEPCHSSHTFSGSISQSVASTSRWPRMSGDEAVVLPSRPPSLFFFLAKPMSNSGSM